MVYVIKNFSNDTILNSIKILLKFYLNFIYILLT